MGGRVNADAAGRWSPIHTASACKPAMASFVKSLFRPDDETLVAHRLYGAAVERARAPVFYTDLGVSDTPTGRFSLIAMHGFMVMERLGGEIEAAGLAQKVFDVMFTDMDRNLREMGVGDLSVGKKVKSLAQHFFGMSAAFRDALKSGNGTLADVLLRNIYGGNHPDAEALNAIAADVRGCTAALAAQPLKSLMQGMIAFPAVPEGK